LVKSEKEPEPKWLSFTLNDCLVVLQQLSALVWLFDAETSPSEKVVDVLSPQQ